MMSSDAILFTSSHRSLLLYIPHPIQPQTPPMAQSKAQHPLPPPPYPPTQPSLTPTSLLIAPLTISPHNFAVGFTATPNTRPISLPYAPAALKSRLAASSKSLTLHISKPGAANTSSEAVVVGAAVAAREESVLAAAWKSAARWVCA